MILKPIRSPWSNNPACFRVCSSQSWQCWEPSPLPTLPVLRVLFRCIMLDVSSVFWLFFQSNLILINHPHRLSLAKSEWWLVSVQKGGRKHSTNQIKCRRLVSFKNTSLCLLSELWSLPWVNMQSLSVPFLITNCCFAVITLAILMRWADGRKAKKVGPPRDAIHSAKSIGSRRNCLSWPRLWFGIRRTRTALHNWSRRCPMASSCLSVLCGTFIDLLDPNPCLCRRIMMVWSERQEILDISSDTIRCDKTAPSSHSRDSVVSLCGFYFWDNHSWHDLWHPRYLCTWSSNW